MSEIPSLYIPKPEQTATEITDDTITRPNANETQYPLSKIDVLDAKARLDIDLYTAWTSIATTLATLEATSKLSPETYNSVVSNLPWAGGVFAAGLLVKAGIDYRTLKHTDNDRYANYNELGAEAVPYVYKGPPLKRDGFILQKNDSIRYAQMAAIKEPDQDLQHDQAQAILDHYQYIFTEMSNFMGNEKTKAVVLDTSIAEVINNARKTLGLPALEALSTENSVTREQIFRDKRSDIQQPQKAGILIKKDIFMQLLLLPERENTTILDEGIHMLTERIGVGSKKKLLSLYEQVKHTSGTANQNARNHLQNYLRNIYLSQSEELFGGSSKKVAFLPGRRNYRIQEISAEKSRDKNPHIIIIDDALGESHDSNVDLSKPLDVLIAGLRQDTNDTKRANSIAAIQLARALRTSIEKNEDYTTFDYLSTAESVIRIEKLGLEFDVESFKRDIVVRKKHLLPKGIFRRIVPVLACAAYLASTPSIPPIVTEIENTIHIGSSNGEYATSLDTQGNTDPSEVNTSSASRFPEKTPQSITDWSISVEGNISEDDRQSFTEGYFVLNTSHIFENGEWIINDENPTKINLPHRITDETPRLELDHGIVLDISGNTTFKIPIKNGMEVGALEITDQHGQALSDDQYTIYRIADGTVKVVVHAGFNKVSYINIIDTLIDIPPESNVGVHATASVTSDLKEINQLSPAAQAEYNRAKQTKLGEEGQIAEALAEDISQRYLYSLDPAGKSAYDKATSAVDKINAMVQLEGIDCTVANTPMILLASLDKGINNQVNYAEGYFETYQSLGSYKGPQLNRAALHGFGIDIHGKPVDGTPKKFDENSQMTTDYIQNTLNNDTEGDNPYLDNRSYMPYQQRIIEQANANQALANDIEIGLITAGVFSSLLAVSKGANVLKRIKREQLPHKEVTSEPPLVRHEPLSLDWITEITKEDLEKSYTFFEWLSYADSTQPHTKIHYKESDEDIMKLDASLIINYPKLQQYLENPTGFEDLAVKQGFEITTGDKRLFRNMGAFFQARAIEETPQDKVSLPQEIQRIFPGEDLQTYIPKANAFLRWWSHPVKKGDPTLNEIFQEEQMKNEQTKESLTKLLNYDLLYRYLQNPEIFERTITEKSLRGETFSIAAKEKKFIRLYAQYLITEHEKETSQIHGNIPETIWNRLTPSQRENIEFLSDANDFIVWLSYSDLQSPIGRVNPESESEIFQNIRLERLQEYVDNPESFENIAVKNNFAFSPEKSIFIRAIANLLLDTAQ